MQGNLFLTNMAQECESLATVECFDTEKAERRASETNSQKNQTETFTPLI